MKNINEEIENKKVANKANNNEVSSLLDFINMQEEKVEQVDAFVKHTIISKVSGYRFYKNDEDKIDKVQIKTAEIDEENGALIEETFTLRGNIIEDEIKALKGKYIKVEKVNRYTHIDRDFKGNEKSRTYTFGGEIENMSIITDNKDTKIFDLNSYVIIKLNSVANVLKGGKASGDIFLISVKENEDGTIQTFKCKLKSAKNQSFDKEMFKTVIGKTLIINYIKEFRMSGQVHYSTETIPDVIV